MDYILPDYYPDVFKLVRCEAVPVISDYSVNGDKLTYELRCDMRILYCSENGSILQCVNQKQTFSKTVDMGRFCDNPSVTLKPKCDYVNCRAAAKKQAFSVYIHRFNGKKIQTLPYKAGFKALLHLSFKAINIGALSRLVL